jgi:colanic acid/amylovoran biosynthesis glycosyltransferase
VSVSAVQPTLLVIPSLLARRAPGGGLLISNKFLTGLQAYAERWPGKVASLLRVAEGPDLYLDTVEHDPAAWPFELGELAWDLGGGLEDQLRAASVVVLSEDPQIRRIDRLCRRLGVPYVPVLEWDAQTRRQILWQEAPSPLRAAKRVLWAEASELGRLRSMRAAAGLQCNGTPTFDAYRSRNRRTLLFFDSRITEDMVIAAPALEARLAPLLSRRPLRLAFSGRLVPIKGADHLPKVAAALARAEVDFTMDICGGGELTTPIREEVQRLGLGDRVRLRGSLDFERELIPFISHDVDLFVCCHTQGDPSCTYLETMACGVPIAGYANQALRGIAQRSRAGWSVPTFEPERLAELIVALDRDRVGVASAARAARSFALAHTFERTMQARIDHFLTCSAPVGARVAQQA